MNGDRSVAYFSMEIAVDPAVPTYAGGLGILAGDTMRACADLEVPIIAVSLLHRRGYLTQSFDSSGWQRETHVRWPVEEHLRELAPRTTIRLEERVVTLRAWTYEIRGASGGIVPVIFLDSDLPENATWDRALTDFLYGGDAYYRLCQEAILGFGGLRMLRALGHQHLTRFHLNEGHASLLTLELLAEDLRASGRRQVTAADLDAVRARCIFTTHTPVQAAYDRFPMPLVHQVLGRSSAPTTLNEVFGPELMHHAVECDQGALCADDVFSPHHTLNLTLLALNLSHYVNGVAKHHAEISRGLLGKLQIDAITNGVHAATWVAPPLQELFDRHIPGWRTDNFSLRYAHSLPPTELWDAHLAAKRQLLTELATRGHPNLDPDKLTLGCARRATPYKRADLLLHDETRLRAIGAEVGPLQIIFGGKAHPNDIAGKEIIQHLLRRRDALRPEIEMVYLENYDLRLAQLLVAGVDVWVNTPLPPLEASGTSGMKAALNGVPSLSTLDGWWLEGCIEDATGWAVGRPELDGRSERERTAADADSLYLKLGQVVAPLFYRDHDRFVSVMRHTIALNGSFFNTQRMVQQYVLKAYFT